MSRYDKPTDGALSIRFAPPLVISEEDIRRAVSIIAESLADFDTVGLVCQRPLCLHVVLKVETIPGEEGGEYHAVIELED